MSSDGSEPAIRLVDLGKMYRMYRQPVDRLKQMLWGRWMASGGYGREFWALRGVTLDIRRGEVVGIIGRNGSGKSTLLQMIAGTLAPTIGTAATRGRLVGLLELGSGMNPEFSGEENMRLMAMLHGFTEAEFAARREAMIAFAAIGDHLRMPVKTYSSGMAVRLAFAVIAHLDPEILIIDEALAVGDISFQRKCFQRFEDLRARGTTILLVTHGVDSVVQLCSRAILIDGGRVLMDGEPRPVVHEYKRIMAEDAAQAAGVVAVAGDAARPSAERPLRSFFKREEATQEFGTGRAEIVDYGVMDADGLPCHLLGDGRVVTFVNEVVFKAPVQDPILTFTVRDLKGNEVTGTNTWFAEREPGPCKAGDRVRATFTQPLSLRAGHYTLSFSCTENTAEGLVVHHRLYDVLIVESTSKRRFVGVSDPLSRVELVHEVAS